MICRYLAQPSYPPGPMPSGLVFPSGPPKESESLLRVPLSPRRTTPSSSFPSHHRPDQTTESDPSPRSHALYSTSRWSSSSVRPSPFTKRRTSRGFNGTIPFISSIPQLQSALLRPSTAGHLQRICSVVSTSSWQNLQVRDSLLPSPNL